MTSGDSALFLLRRAKLIKERASPDKFPKQILFKLHPLPRKLEDYLWRLIRPEPISRRTVAVFPDTSALSSTRGEVTSTTGTCSCPSNSVTVALSLNFEKVNRAHPDALKLLQLFAFLYHDTISAEMIEQGAHALDSPLQKLGTVFSRPV